MGMQIAIVAFIGDVISSATYQVGFLFQKLAHRHLEKQKLQERSDANSKESSTSEAYCSWRFIFGFALCILGTVIHIFVLPYLDLVLMSCNCLTSMMVAQVLSTTVLGERFIFKYDFWGMLLMVIGCGTIVYNANTQQDEYTVEQAIAILTAPVALCTIAFSICFLVSTICILDCFTSKLRRFETAADNHDACQEQGQFRALPPRLNLKAMEMEECQGGQPLLEHADSGVSSEVQRPVAQLIAALHNMDEEQLGKISLDSISLKRRVKMPMVASVACSTLMSGVSMVFLKVLTELIAVNLFWERPILAVSLIICTFGSGFFQIHMLNKAMKMYDQLEVMPIYLTLIMIVWILTGMFIFNELKYYSKTQLFIISAALIVCCLGIKCLASKRLHTETLPHTSAPAIDTAKLNSSDSPKDIESVLNSRRSADVTDSFHRHSETVI